MTETGIRVKVPIGNREIIGYVVRFPEKCDIPVKPIMEIVDREPVISKNLLDLTEWVSNYYHCGWGEAIRAALPPGMDAKQQKMVWFNSNHPDPLPDDPLLEYVMGKTAASYGFLVKKFGSTAEKIIEDYRVKGVLFAEPVWQKARVGIRKERWLSACENNDFKDIKLSKGQDTLLKDLLKIGELSPSAIGKRGHAARKLVSLGLAVWEWREKERGQDERSWDEVPVEVLLTDGQNRVLNSIMADLTAGSFSVNLLAGVTSSGKTEVYLRAAEKSLAMGKQVMILVPEIGMTSQMIHRVRTRLGKVAVWHSEMGSGERYDVWRAVKRGDYRVVVGTRSAVFAPLDDLGLMVIDEEHDASYKQSDMAPLYHARDLAILRAKKEKAVVLMGSATPSVESYHKANSGKFKLFTLEKRVGSSDMPVMEVVDLKKLSRDDRLISPKMEEEIVKCLGEGRQAMILLNRRGFAPYVQCGRCGTLISCPNCSVSLTYHRSGEIMLCHYCGYQARLAGNCPACGSLMLQHRGAAIQRLESELKTVFTGVTVSRMDADTTGRKGEHHRILQNFLSGGAQILVGTQMISKGHHFPNVALVGIINLDDTLGLPDFRAAERAFQLMVQMSGRTGRGEHPGKVVIQTRIPENPVIQWSQNNDYISFAENELRSRQECGYPPFRHLALMTFSGSDQEQIQSLSGKVAEFIRNRSSRVEILGPAPAPLNKIKGKYRWQILLKAGSPTEIKTVLNSIGPYKKDKVKILVDVDPQNML